MLAPTAHAASTLSLSTTQAQHGTQLTISYTTDDPDPTNWVGIYAVEDGEPDGDPGSRVWQYAPGEDGSLTFTIDPAVLPAGDYRAYYLALDGYSSLTAPVDFEVAEAPPGVKAVVPSFGAKSARVGSAYSIKVSGLFEVTGGGDSKAQHRRSALGEPACRRGRARHPETTRHRQDPGHARRLAGQIGHDHHPDPGRRGVPAVDQQAQRDVLQHLARAAPASIKVR